MATLRDIQRRIRSVQSTQKITKAMKLVAASKFRRAQERILAARPYATKMRELLGGLAGHQPHINTDGNHVAHHGNDAGHHGRCKQLGNVLLGQNGVDDQRNRRRNQNAQGATGRQGASGQAPRITVAFHLRQCHRRDGGGRGH